MKTLQESLETIVKSVLTSYELFLVDIELKGSAQNQIVSVFLDSEQGGVNIDQCAKISREVSFLIESDELFTGKYTLNVSSPGLDRPLKDERQFLKNIGRNASVTYISGDERKKVKGVLKSFAGGTVVLETGKGSLLEIVGDDLIELKIIPVF